MTRGYFGIGVYYPKTEHNIGTLWRSAYQFGAAFIFTIGRRYKRQSSDTLKAVRHIPLYNYECLDDFLANRPLSCILAGIEMGGSSLESFCHPVRCIYLLGAEDNGLPSSVLERCNCVVSIPTVGPVSLNVSVAGSIVMYDRLVRGIARG